jgi:hypothetical protein
MQAEGSKTNKYTTSIAIPDNCMNTADTDPSKITWNKDSENYWIADSFPVNYTGCTFKEAKLYLPDNINPNQHNIWTKNTNDTKKWDLTYIQDIDGGKRKSKKNKRKSKSRKSKKSRKTKSRKSKKSKSHKK